MTPRTTTAKNKTFLIHVSEEDLEAWREAATAEDLAIADWIRRACRAALAKLKKK